MPLNKFQTDFKDLILDHPDALNDLDSDFADLFQKNGIALSKRLAVYRNNIVGSLTDVMLESFPTLKALVGEEFLTAMARSFVLTNPPEAGCLNYYGRGFAEFIETFPPAADLPYLPDIARLEIAWNDTYYAIDEIAFTVEDLAKKPPEELPDFHLALAEHVNLIVSDYPIKALWDYCRHDHDTNQAIAAPDINGGGIKLMTYRDNLRTHFKELNDCEYTILSALSNGQTLGMALELISDEEFDFAAFLGDFIAIETFRAS